MGVKELCKIDGIGETTAEKLVNNGINDVTSLVVRNVAEIASMTGSSETTVRKWQSMARDLLDISSFEPGDKVEKKQDKRFYISTGSKEFDRILNGGVRSQAVTEAYGQFKSGKTQLSHQLAVNVQLEPLCGKVVWIDTENTFSAKRIREMAAGVGLDPEKVLKNILVAKAHDSDHQCALAIQIEKLLTEKKHNIKLIIIDSLMSHFRAEFVGRDQLPARGGKVGAHMSLLHKLADIHDIAVYVTNQVTVEPAAFYGDPTKPIGGHIVGHSSTFRVYLRMAAKGQRAALLLDAPDLPDAHINFNVLTEGIRDV
jgi:DNA repair protein RadA